MGARQSGLLTVECGELSGEIGVESGQVVFASCNEAGLEQLGEDAFVGILKKAQVGGKFVFEKKDVSDLGTNIDKRTDHLLLGIANMLDEA